MANAEARRTKPGPLEVVEIERSFLREVGSVFWFIANTFQETMERVQQEMPLAMGWCLDCHQARGVGEHGARTDCVRCHH